MTNEKEKMTKKKKVAWGITGSGDKLQETVAVMSEVKRQYEDVVDVEVYLSKAAEQVVKYYRLGDELKNSFRRVTVEVDSNSPFLAGWLETGKYEFMLIAPVTSNTVAKISVGIADTLLSNATIMALKASVPTYVMPCDHTEGSTQTKLPSGQDITLKVRKEDAANVRKLEKMENVFVIKKPQDIRVVFRKHFENG
ncbi:MAG TPA: archaeoflavoprotein AfpA [Candidatus Acidoferrum sp.]|nr:archaeoflavoprotein AfpA [Candidatus Acidoferrum sp.]